MSGILTTVVNKIAPSAANGVTLTSGLSWANGSFAQLLAATSASAQLLGFNFDSPPSGTDDYELDFATGGAGSEVVFTTIPFSSPSAGVATGGQWQITLPSPISGIGSSARISARLRNASANARTQVIAISYIESTDATNATSHGISVVPSAANNVSVTPNGSAFASSNYTQLTASISSEIQFAGLDFNTTASVPEYEFDLATGGAGSEVVQTTLRGFGGTGTASQIMLIMLQRAYAILKNTRVAVRMRKGGTDTTAYTFKLAYYTDRVLQGGGNGAGKTNNKGKGKGGGVTVITPGGAFLTYIGNFGIDISVGS